MEDRKALGRAKRNTANRRIIGDVMDASKYYLPWLQENIDMGSVRMTYL